MASQNHCRPILDKAQADERQVSQGTSQLGRAVNDDLVASTVWPYIDLKHLAPTSRIQHPTPTVRSFGLNVSTVQPHRFQPFGLNLSVIRLQLLAHQTSQRLSQTWHPASGHLAPTVRPSDLNISVISASQVLAIRPQTFGYSAPTTPSSDLISFSHSASTFRLFSPNCSVIQPHRDLTKLGIQHLAIRPQLSGHLASRVSTIRPQPFDHSSTTVRPFGPNCSVIRPHRDLAKFGIQHSTMRNQRLGRSASRASSNRSQPSNHLVLTVRSSSLNVSVIGCHRFQQFGLNLSAIRSQLLDHPTSQRLSQTWHPASGHSALAVRLSSLNVSVVRLDSIPPFGQNCPAIRPQQLGHPALQLSGHPASQVSAIRPQPFGYSAPTIRISGPNFLAIRFHRDLAKFGIQHSSTRPQPFSHFAPSVRSSSPNYLVIRPHKDLANSESCIRPRDLNVSVVRPHKLRPFGLNLPVISPNCPTI
ncbi:hypothetical protein LR48_Vigan462s001100 [Vigna angularis]|uniref:Uncharacterized protein n=1 Tax=Phaseolus angularis TaxID=3914 RepID=A0A0L9TB30_PHAAN|nr:hypothetical protein LR48_Vigan462s001100 [Vigna angularis]